MSESEKPPMLPVPANLNEQGRSYLDEKKYDKALDSFEQTIKLAELPDNDRLDALVGKGSAFRELRKFEEAENVFQEASAVDDNSRTLLIEWGWLRFYQKLHKQAFSNFEKALAASPQDAEDSAKLGMLTARQALDVNSPTYSEVSAKELMSQWCANGLSPEQAISLLSQCNAILERLNLYPAFLASIEQLLTRDPDNEAAWGDKISALKYLRRYKDAEETYQKAQAKWPASLRIWNEAANLFYEQKRFRDAYHYYSGEALKESPLAKMLPAWRIFETSAARKNLKDLVLNDETAKEWTIVSLRKMRRFDDARKRIDEGLLIDPNDVDLLCEKAFIYYVQRNYDRAIEYFQRALRISDYDRFAHQWLIAALRKKASATKPSEGAAAPDFTEAKKALAEALKKLSYDTGILEESAWLEFDQGNLEQALKDFDQAIDLDPYLIHKQFSKIEILARLNRSDDALKVFQRLEENFPNDAEVAEQLCWFYLRLSKPELALEQLQKLKDHHSGNVLAVNARGGYELDQRNYSAAVKYFSEAIAGADYEPQYYINLAWALVRQIKAPAGLTEAEISKRERLIEKARENCQKALTLDPYNSKAYTCLGVIAFSRHTFLDAEHYFRKSIELNPSEGSYVELASLYCQMGRYDDATKQLETALRLNPNDARVHIELGNVSVWKEEIKEAVKHCRQAIIVEPKNPETYRALVIALMRTEKIEEAEIEVRKALQVLPPARSWRLHLLLAQILIRIGDTDNKDRKPKERDLDRYEEALNCVYKAKAINSSDADIFFHEGIAHYRLENYGSSQKSLAECLKLNKERFEAERYSRIVQGVINQQRQLFNVNKFFGYLIAGACLVLLTVLWLQYFRGDQRTIIVTTPPAAAGDTSKSEPTTEFSVTPTLLTTMTPILLGLLVVAALLPNLNTLKLPGGFEAVIHEPKAPDANISTGPRGEIGFGSSLPIIDPEPR
jgi:tetratricopeptide (TPR) repeat protein